MTTETETTLCIVGAGIAGLSAGIYGQLNGFSTQIFEKHSLPGGLCTAWQRRGYWFDGCIRYLVGSGPDQWGYSLMNEVGAVGERPFIYHDAFTCVETQTGTQVTFYADIDRLEQHLIALVEHEAMEHDAAAHGDAAHDVAHIRAFTRAARGFARARIPYGPPQGLGGLLRAAPQMVHYLPLMLRWGKVSLRQFSDGFRSPTLREAFAHFYNYADVPDMPVIIPMMVAVAQFSNRNAGVPQGGSLALARDVERRYLELGGQVHYRAPVERILVDASTERGCARTPRAHAAGIRLADGTEHRADIVLSAADAHATLLQMLGEPYVPPAYREAFRQRALVPPIVQVSLGVARTFEGVPHITNWPLHDPVVVAGQAHHRLGFEHYGYDPTLAPEGKTSVLVVYETEYAPWKALVGDRAAYEAEKERIAEQVIDRLDARFPGLRGQVEVVDVATPLTTERYTGNWQGSPQGWQVTVQNLTHNLPSKLDRLERFYMAGQWVRTGGGVTGGLLSARNTIRQICRDLGRPFVSGS
jgi:phytoene dehydrogenase-like protein